MAYDNDTIRLIRFEAINAPEDSDATITLIWQVANAEQVTIEGPGVGAAGLNRRTIHTGAGQLHIKTSETKASYTLTAAPDPKRLINGQCDYDVNGNLIPSYFRVYRTVEESYKDHSIFLIK